MARIIATTATAAFALTRMGGPATAKVNAPTDGGRHVRHGPS